MGKYFGNLHFKSQVKAILGRTYKSRQDVFAAISELDDKFDAEEERNKNIMKEMEKEYNECAKETKILRDSARDALLNTARKWFQDKQNGKDSAPKKVNDATPHSVVAATEKYLSSKGYNNSVGKYDKVVFGVRSLLGQGYLEGEELEKAVAREAERLLKKYNLTKDSAPEKVYDSFTGMMVEKGQESEFQKSYDSAKAKDKVYSVGYKATESGSFQSIGVVANSESEALAKFKKHKPDVFKVFGASSNSESLETMKKKGKPIIDEAIEKLKSNDSNGYYVNGYYIFWNKRTGLWEVSKNGQVKFTTYSEDDAVEWAKKH